MSRRDDRCPPVPLRVQKLLPAWSFKMFCMAASEGRSMNTRGDYNDLLRGERPVGIRIAEVHRDRVLDAAGVKLRHWQDASLEWVQLGLAHRCKRGELFLMLEGSAQERCWHCGGELEARSGCVSTRTESVHDAHSERPSYVQKREPTTGKQRGKDVEVDRSEALEVKEPKAVQKTPRRDQKRFVSEEEAWEAIKEAFGDDAADL